jgi:hypothetical protein
MVEKLWGFKDFIQSLGMISATVNAAKFAQICPKLPKTTKIYLKTFSLRNFEIPPKFEIFIFFQKKILHIAKH